MERLLFQIGEGLGNQVETIPSLLYLSKVHSCPIDVINTIPTYRDTSAIFNALGFKTLIGINPSNYSGQYRSFSCAMANLVVPNIPLLNTEPDGYIQDHSEVCYNLRICDDKYRDEDRRVDPALFESFHKLDGLNVDVIVHNGFNKFNPTMWSAKAYPHYKKLVDLLLQHKISVGSIGSEDEYIAGTVNMTKLPIASTIRVLKTAKLLIANDTGTYHLACLLGIPTLVLFTFTSIVKNRDAIFHHSSTVLTREDLECRPCQYKSPAKYWLNNRHNCHWECQNIDSEIVYKEALKKLGVV